MSGSAVAAFALPFNFITLSCCCKHVLLLLLLLLLVSMSTENWPWWRRRHTFQTSCKQLTAVSVSVAVAAAACSLSLLSQYSTHTHTRAQNFGKKLFCMHLQSFACVYCLHTRTHTRGATSAAAVAYTLFMIHSLSSALLCSLSHDSGCVVLCCVRAVIANVYR